MPRTAAATVRASRTRGSGGENAALGERAVDLEVAPQAVGEQDDAERGEPEPIPMYAQCGFAGELGGDAAGGDPDRDRGQAVRHQARYVRSSPAAAPARRRRPLSSTR